MSNEDDGSLLRDGECGVGQMYDRHSRAVFRLAYALLRDPEIARDIVQDTFVLAWRKHNTVTLLNESALHRLLTPRQVDRYRGSAPPRPTSIAINSNEPQSSQRRPSTTPTRSGKHWTGSPSRIIQF